jgi:hypothetical protein
MIVSQDVGVPPCSRGLGDSCGRVAALFNAWAARLASRTSRLNFQNLATCPVRRNSTTGMTPEIEQLVRDCADGKVSWRDLAPHGYNSYYSVLGLMADLGLRPYMAPLTGKNAEQRLRWKFDPFSLFNQRDWTFKLASFLRISCLVNFLAPTD